MLEERLINLKVITYAILYVFIFLIVALIILIFFGIIQYSPGFCFMGAILIICFLIWGHYRRAYRLAEDKQEIQRRKQYELKTLPKIYNFYCPHCLHQTNKVMEVCPNCGVGKLAPTKKYLREQKRSQKYFKC